MNDDCNKSVKAGFGEAHGSATVEKPHKVHVWVYGHYCGPYEFATAEEADADYEYRKGFHVLGCHYRRESPNDQAFQAMTL
jgi:hypothetical protein